MTKKLTVIYNPFVNSFKNQEQTALFQKASKKLKIKLDLIPSDQIDPSINLNKHNFSRKILYLEKNIPLAIILEAKGYKLYNNSHSIRICDNKALTHAHACESKIAQPKTLIGPLTFNLKQMKKDNHFIYQVEQQLSYPVVLKEAYGSFGHQVYLIKNKDELIQKINSLQGKEFIVQEYLDKKPGQGIRVLVINKKIYGAIEQINHNDFRSNLTLGSSGSVVQLPKYAIQMVNKIVNKLNLFYGGIDLMYDNNNKLIFCEANSNAQLVNISNIFNINFAEHLLTNILED